MATATKTKPKKRTFAVRINERRRAGKCCCWDCLRSIGLTPPLGVRHAHPQVHKGQPREVGWVRGFELEGEDRDQFKGMRVPPIPCKGGTGRYMILAEHRAADHILNKEMDLMKKVRMV